MLTTLAGGVSGGVASAQTEGDCPPPWGVPGPLVGRAERLPMYDPAASGGPIVLGAVRTPRDAACGPGVLGTEEFRDTNVQTLYSWDPDRPGGRPAQLIAGGLLTGLKFPDASRIWDGLVWRPLGPGFDTPCGMLGAAIDFRGDLVVAGSVDRPAQGIARSDGSAWHPLGSGIAWMGMYSTGVWSMAVFENDLIIA